MQLGMIGLGRMGANMVRRLIKDGHDCVVFDVNEDTVSQLESEGAAGSASLAEFVSKLEKPRSAWIMVPAALVGRVVDELMEHLEPGDAIIDGGNSYYRDDIDRAALLAPKGVHLVDVGTSGGVHGLDRGFCLMIGGDDESVQRLEPIFASLAPGVDTAPRTEGKTGDPSPAEQGYLHCGPNGAGHFVKMVHNGIEYGIMAAYAEGLNVLHKANAGKLQPTEASAEVTPLRQPEYYQFDIPVPDVAEVWRRGSVVASWLLDLTAHALSESPGLDDFGGFVSDSGEGRWTVLAAVEEAVPVPVLSSALYERFSSRGEAQFADKLLSAMRKEFGGHTEMSIDS
jgi:6-phosphogluconate dehydrogenase